MKPVLDVEERIVYLDLDGVLVDFVDRVYQLFDYTKSQRADLMQQVPDWGSVHVPLGCSKAVMWRTIDQAGAWFWSQAPWRPGGRCILVKAESMGEVYLCSSPSQAPHSAQGKLEWVQRNLPDYADRYHLTQHKHHLAQPGRVLIDDNPANCEAFIRAGGAAYLVSHPCNKGSDMARLDL